MFSTAAFYKTIGFGCLLFVYVAVSYAKQPERETLPKDKNGVVHILAIGNSFSMDATERHLRELAKGNGVKLLIANLYISGATLQMHWDNARNNNTVYEYRVVDKDGVLSSLKGVSLQQALSDKKWDYISFQQSSASSGQYATYQSLPNLYTYVKTLVPSQTKFIFHQTWAYAESLKKPQFKRYNYNQKEMYDAIIHASAKADELVGFDIFIPAGTAIQNARTSVVGDKLTRDGYHLNELGRYTAACTWFEAIFRQSVVGNSYRPDGVSKQEAMIAQRAAHFAVVEPYTITMLGD